MRHRLSRAAAVAAAVLLAGSPGTAYLTIRDDTTGASILWKLSTPAANVIGGTVTYYVDESSAVGVGDEAFGDAARAAVASWGAAPGTAITFAEDPTRPASQRNLSDRVNRVGFQAGLLGPGVLGKTYTLWSGTRILETDVVLNPDLGGGAFGWSTQFPGNPTKADVQGVVAHEWGHAIGLAHSALSRSTMFYAAPFGGVSLRSLETDDLAAVAHAYPSAAPPATGTIEGKVDVAGAFDDRGIQVTAIETISGLPAAAAISGPDGSYAIEGLAPGTYRVVASPLGTLYVGALVYNSAFWDSAITEVLPSILAEDDEPGSPAATLVLGEGATIHDVDLVVTQSVAPREPDNGRAFATPLLPGRCVAARTESGSDADWYSFEGAEGDFVTILVQAAQLGSRLDARIYLRDSDGILVPGTGAQTDDISAVATSAVGRDLDARIHEFPLPGTGTYYVEVESVNSVDTSRVEDYFYLLTLLRSGGEPSPQTSVFTASPGILVAGTGGTSDLLFRPRSADGILAGAGRDVTMVLASEGDAGGVLSAVVDEGDGTYSATLTAAATEATDLVTARVDGVDVSTVTVYHRGGPDFAASEFRSVPRRIRFDGAATARLVFVPRDSQGVPFGAGWTVHMDEAIPGASKIGSTHDMGDGSYEAVLTAGLVAETASVGAEVEGVPVVGAYGAEIGFPLGDVVDDAAEDILAEMETSNPPPIPKAAARLGKACAILKSAGLLSPDEEARKVCARVVAALKQLEAAAKRGEPMDDLSRELVEAVREKARTTLIAAAPEIDSNLDVRSYERATAALGLGEAYLEAGLYSKAATRFFTAWKHAAKID